MDKNHTTRKLIAGLALVAGITGLGAGVAGAQTTQTTQAAAASPSAGQHGPGRGHRGGPGAMHGQVLATLVKGGTITQAKADAIVQAFQAARPQKPAAGTGTGTASATPPAGRPDPATAHKAVLDSLVKAGTITQTEADAVQKALDAARPARGDHGPGRPGDGRGPRDGKGPRGEHRAQLDALVKAGTISQAKADAVVQAFEAARPQKPVAGTNTGTGSATPRADRPDPVAAHKAVLDSLVKAGTITQTEADAILKSITDARPMGGQGAGHPGGRDGMPGRRGGRR